MKTMHTSRTNIQWSQGFSLIEVLISLTVFAFVISGFANLLVGSLQANGYAKRMTTAATVAQDKLEEIRNDTAACTNSSVTQGEITYTVTCTTAAGPTAGTQEITVTVDWDDQAAHTLTLKSLVVL
ncbi:MAG: prepilin-type N-terminal cleavage/methylation domain-containing protein [Candidatus Binatia bacterium]